jgi:hypothetical protein
MRPALILSSLLLLSAVGATAADPPAEPAHHAARLAVLSLPERYTGSRDDITFSMRDLLRDELRDAGYDAVTTRETYDDLDRHNPSNADYYVEVVYVDASGRPLVGVDVSSHDREVRASAHVSLVKTATSIDVRVYEGQSLELVDQYHIDKTRVAPMLSDVSLSARHLPLFLAVSLFNRATRTSVVRAVAHDAAARINLGGVPAERP